MEISDGKLGMVYETTMTADERERHSAGPFTQSLITPASYRIQTHSREARQSLLPSKHHQPLSLQKDADRHLIPYQRSNVPTNSQGEFTNVKRDFYSDRQGMWFNAMHNTPGATIERGVGTYSNLQGSWARVGPSTYDATHGKGHWVSKWSIYTFEPATLRSLYDHRNVDPRDNWVPIESVPQNMPY